ncbi:MAG TPA: hypothetical protein VFX97_20630 [Pyrinomonadaceae bacterium]|nr:hypothetical protein [Pyrinomonadaceae bacterium]
MASDAVVNLVVDATGAQAEVRAQLTQIVNDAERTAPPVNINLVIDQRTVNNTLNQTINQLDETSRRAGDADNEVSRLGDTFSRLGRSALSAVTSAARLGAISSLAAAALPAVGALVAGLLNIAPAAAAGVTAFVGLKAATLSLKVGLIGVEDALGQVFAAEPDAEALADALERLAPEARAFVLEMQRLRPALDDIRLDVQNRLFRDLDEQLKETATSSLPVLRRAALDFAGTFNTVAANTAASAQGLSESGALGRALRSGGIAFNNLARIPGQLLNAIIKLSVGGGPLLIRLTDRIADVADSLTAKLDQAAKSGALKEAIDEAAATIRQLGRIAGNVFGALGNIMETASEAGGGLFGSLERITQALEDLTATDGFKDVLTALITTGQTLITNILPLLQRAFEILGPVITTLAPPVQALINLIGARLIETLDLLAPTFAILGEAVANLITALSPIVDLFFTLLNAILPVLNPLLSALNEIIIALTPIIQVLAEELGAALVPVIEALIPIITLLAQFIADVVVAIAPLIEEILPIVVDWFTRWAPVIAKVLEELTPLIDKILEFAAFLTEKLVEALIEVIDWIRDLAAKYEELAGKTIERILLPAFRALVAFLDGDYKKAWEGAKNVAVTAGIGMATSVRDTLDGIKNQFILLSIRLPGMVNTAMSGVINAFRSGGSGALSVIRRFTFDAVARIFDAAGDFFSAGQRLMLSLASGIVSQIGSVVSAVGDAVGRARDLLPFSPAKRGPFSGRGYPLYSGQAIMESLAEGITSRSGLVSAAMQSALSGSPLAAPALAGTSTSGGFGRAVSGALSTTVAAPNVSVYLGNELLTDRMRVVVDDANRDRDRQASQGVRF